MRSFIIPAFAMISLVSFAGSASSQQQPTQGGTQSQGMDMNASMARCAQIRQQPATSQTAQGRQMLDQCDQMDRGMGMTPPPRR